MKRNYILLVITIILISAGLYFYMTDNKSTSSRERQKEYDFALTDTASITKIVITDKTPGNRRGGRVQSRAYCPAGKALPGFAFPFSLKSDTHAPFAMDECRSQPTRFQRKQGFNHD